MALSRFREARTTEEELNLVQNAVPKSTQYKNKRTYGIFEEWKRQRIKVTFLPAEKCQKLPQKLVVQQILVNSCPQHISITVA